MAHGVGFSDQWRKAEREERDRLRALETRLDALQGQRRQLLGEVRALSSRQHELYDQHQGPQAAAERLYHESGELGRQLGHLRRSVEKARQGLEDAVIRRRELVLTFDRNERLNPEQVRREIAELELRQQTRALPIEEENALIAELRRKSKALQEFEARKELAAKHVQQRQEADAAIVAARGEIDKILKEMDQVRGERDKRKGEIPASLEAAGAAVAEMRAAGRSRAELMAQVDALSRDIAEVEREGRELLAKLRARQEAAREILEEYSRPLPTASGKPASSP